MNAVASFSILGDMVQRVGGARVAVTTIVGPNADSHVYEPKPSDAAAVGAADIFFVNGLGFEGWMERLVEATGYSGPLVTVSAGVATHEMADEAERDDHDHGAVDPHAWQSLANGLVYVDNITNGLCGVDAAGCETYMANAVSYKAEMSSLDATIKSEIAAIPEAKRKVITSHDAFGYFGAAYGVTFMAPEGTSTESEASAKDIAALIEQIRGAGCIGAVHGEHDRSAIARSRLPMRPAPSSAANCMPMHCRLPMARLRTICRCSATIPSS